MALTFGYQRFDDMMMYCIDVYKRQVMSDRWFDEYTYQIVVNKKYLTQQQRTIIDEEPIKLKPWDPMGSLAKEW